MLDQLPGAGTRIERTIDRISTWDFSRISLEITGDENAVFKIFLSPQRTLYLGLNLNEEGNNDSYFAYYEQDGCKHSGIGSFTDIVSDLATLKIL